MCGVMVGLANKNESVFYTLVSNVLLYYYNIEEFLVTAVHEPRRDSQRIKALFPAKHIRCLAPDRP